MAALSRLAQTHSASIKTDLGDPDFTESFQRHGDEFMVLYYRNRRIHDDSQTTIEETAPLVFIENNLVGWGQSAIEMVTR